MNLALNRFVYSRKLHQYVRTSQIDHIVIGPPGVILIESKNWSQKSFDNNQLDPFIQIDRASLIFYILSQRHFNDKVPTRNFVVSTRKIRPIKYSYVDFLSMEELIPYIENLRVKFSPENVDKVSRWLKKFI